MADDDVRVTFGADTNAILSAIDSVKDKISGMKQPADDAKSAFDELKDSVIAAFSVEAVKNFVESFAELGTQITRMQQEFNLSAEAVQEWRYAMQATGGEASNFSTAMIRLSSNVDAAIESNGRQRTAFAQLGITVQDLKDHYGDLNTIAAKVADGFQDLHAKGGGVSELLALMGRSAGNLIPLFNGGSEAIEEMQQRALATGGVLSDSLVAALKDTHEKIVDMSSALSGAGAQAFALFKPMIDSVISVVTELAREFNILVSSIRFGVEVISESLSVMAAAFALHFDHAKEHIAALQKDWDEYVKNIQNINGQSAPNNAQQKPGDAPKNKDDTYEEDTAFDKQDIADKLALESAYYEQRKAMAENSLAEGKITKAEEFAAEKQYLTDKYQAEQNALSDELNVYGLSEQEYQKILDTKALLNVKFNTQMAQINSKSLQEQNAQYKSFFESINTAVGSMVQGILQGTQTWQQAMAHLFDNLLAKFIEDFVVKKVTAWVQSEITQTSATVAGNTARTASTVAAAAVGSAASSTASIAQIGKSAAVSAANVYASVSAIPYVGWLLAPPAAAAAFAAVEIFGSDIASFAVGSYDVPGDMLANIHQGEMIIPKTFADSIRSGDGGGLGGSGGNFNININAIDTQTGAAFLKNNAASIAQIMQQNVRNFNSNTMQSARST